MLHFIKLLKQAAPSAVIICLQLLKRFKCRCKKVDIYNDEVVKIIKISCSVSLIAVTVFGGGFTKGFGAMRMSTIPTAYTCHVTPYPKDLLNVACHVMFAVSAELSCALSKRVVNECALAASRYYRTVTAADRGQLTSAVCGLTWASCPRQLVHGSVGLPN